MEPSREASSKLFSVNCMVGSTQDERSWREHRERGKYSQLRFKLLMAVLVLSTSAGCVDEVAPADVLENHDSVVAPVTYVLVCDDNSRFTVRATESEAWLFHSTGTLNLMSVAAAQQSEYANDQYRLSISGENAEFATIGAETVECLNDRRSAIWEHAKLNGADFRAVGNEPGWNLEIQEGSRIVLVADYGASRTEVALPEPIENSIARTTRWDTAEFTLEVSGNRCTDSMSGESFESTVVVTWGETVLRGCGRALH